MRILKILGVASLVAGGALLSPLGFGGSIANAQNPGSPAGSPAGSPPAGAVAPGNAAVNPNAPVDAQSAPAKVARMEATRENIRRELQGARTKHDVVKQICLDDKLNQIDVALEGASKRMRALELAQTAGNQADVEAEMTIIDVIFQRAVGLEVEAKQCIGKEVGFVGESSVTVNVDDGLPNEDPSDYPLFDDGLYQPPNCSSCYR